MQNGLLYAYPPMVQQAFFKMASVIELKNGEEVTEEDAASN